MKKVPNSDNVMNKKLENFNSCKKKISRNINKFISGSELKTFYLISNLASNLG